MKIINNTFRSLLHKFGIDIIKLNKSKLPSDFDAQSTKIFNAVKKYTMTNAVRTHVLIEAVKYVVKHKIPGAFVECGVWRGGAAMTMAYTLLDLEVTDRDIYLYDTYTGMSEPSSLDVTVSGVPAKDKYQKKKFTNSAGSDWCFSPLEEVKNNLLKTDYPKDRLIFVKGKVEETIPETMPDKISLLRLDTDWYDSTKHELEHLFPLLSPYGILIIDDYGRWQGSKKAVDEYIETHAQKIFLSRIDRAARIAIKV